MQYVSSMTSYSGTAIIRFPVPAAKNKFAGTVALPRNLPARISRPPPIYRRIGPGDYTSTGSPPTLRARTAPPKTPITRLQQLTDELWSLGTLPTVRCDPTSGVAINIT